MNENLKTNTIDFVKHPEKVANEIINNSNSIAGYMNTEAQVVSDHSLKSKMEMIIAPLLEYFKDCIEGIAPVMAMGFLYLLKGYLVDGTSIKVEGDPASLAFVLFAIVIALLTSIGTIQMSAEDKRIQKERRNQKLKDLQTQLNTHYDDPSLGMVHHERLESKLEPSKHLKRAERILQIARKGSQLVTLLVCSLVLYNLAIDNRSAGYAGLQEMYLISLFISLLSTSSLLYSSRRYQNKIVRHFMGQRPQKEVGEYQELAELDAQKPKTNNVLEDSPDGEESLVEKAVQRAYVPVKK
jgi:hypothetical protein